MDYSKLEERVKNFYPSGSIQTMPHYRSENGAYVFKNYSIQIMKLEYEIEKYAPLKIAVYIKYVHTGGYIMFKTEDHVWHTKTQLSGMSEEREMLSHMFTNLKYVGVHFIKFYKEQSAHGFIVGFGPYAKASL
jgi:hypothetical protein